jgi:hypothetical protein
VAAVGSGHLVPWKTVDCPERIGPGKIDPPMIDHERIGPDYHTHSTSWTVEFFFSKCYFEE